MSDRDPTHPADALCAACQLQKTKEQQAGCCQPACLMLQLLLDFSRCAGFNQLLQNCLGIRL